ncbi:MAG: methyltransferase domain-containing protein [Candidatus Dormibacteria bacterium]
MLRPLAEQLVAVLDVQRGAVAGDVMCDAGVLTSELARAVGADGTVIACDSDVALADAAASAAGGACSAVAQRTDGATLAMDTASCDVVASLITLPLGHTMSLLHECGRVLRDDGTLGVLVWDPSAPPAHEAALQQVLEEHGAHSPLLDGLLASVAIPAGFATRTLHDVARLHTFTHLWPAMQGRIADATASGAALDRDALRARYEELMRPYTAVDGTITMPLRATLITDGRAR